MSDYKKMYTALFNQVTDTIRQLQEIQQQTEAMYLEDEVLDFPRPAEPPKEHCD